MLVRHRQHTSHCVVRLPHTALHAAIGNAVSCLVRSELVRVCGLLVCGTTADRPKNFVTQLASCLKCRRLSIVSHMQSAWCQGDPLTVVTRCQWWPPQLAAAEVSRGHATAAAGAAAINNMPKAHIPQAHSRQSRQPATQACSRRRVTRRAALWQCRSPCCT